MIISALVTAVGLSFVYVGLSAFIIVHPRPSEVSLVVFAVCWMWSYAFWGTVWHVREVSKVFEKYDWDNDKWLISNVSKRMIARLKVGFNN